MCAMKTKINIHGPWTEQLLGVLEALRERPCYCIIVVQGIPLISCRINLDVCAINSERGLHIRLVEATKTVDAIEYGRASIAATLKAAREHVGLMHEELAHKLKELGYTLEPAFISNVESGAIDVEEEYVRDVLTVCGLPEDWTGAG